MKLKELEAAVEAILFAAGEAVPLSRIALAIEQDVKTARSIVQGVIDQYEAEGRGIEIICINESYQMRTRPAFYNYINVLYSNPQKRGLTQTLIETLAIIAYRQPVTKTDIEEIRGVSADHAVNKLMEYGLVCEKGRLEAPGKPILFGTTDEFLKYYGFSSLEGLPLLPDNDEQLRVEAESEIENALG